MGFILSLIVVNNIHYLDLEWICIGMEYICSKCHVSKPSAEYFFREKGYRRKQCKSCCYENNRKAYNHDRERYRKISQIFGISKDDYDAMLAAQKGVCAICGKHQKITVRNRGNLCVDHNHVTGRVRGLLCSNCNQALGLFGDSSKVLLSAASYLITDSKSCLSASM